MAIIKALVTAAALFTTSALGAPVVDKVSLPHITPTATIPGGETHVTSFVTPSPEPWWITVPDTHTVPFTPGPGHWSTVITVRGTPITMGPAPAWATVDKDDEHRRSDWDPVAWRPLLGEAQRGLLGEKVGPVAKRDVAAEVPHNCSDAHRECCPTPKQQNPCGIWGGVWKRNDTDRPPGQVWKRDHAANELPAGPDALHADESHPQSSGRPSTAFDPTADKGNEKVPMMGSCDKGHPECCPTPQNADPCGIWGGVWKRDEDGHADKDDIPWWFWGGKDKRAEDNQAGKGDIPWWFWSGKQQREDNIEKDKGTGCNTFGCEFQSSR